MSKEPGRALASSVPPSPCSFWISFQSFELPHRPSNQMLVDAQCDGIQLGAIEGSVIVDPAPHLGVDAQGESGQVSTCATFEVPIPPRSLIPAP
jgi:hypothetical protein